MSSLTNVLPCTFVNYEFARQTRFCWKPLTSCQYSAIFCSTKKSQSKMYTEVRIQNRHGGRWFYAAASLRSKLDVEQCTRRYTAQQRHGRRRISFFPFVFRYAAVLERERKNLSPMMQEREKDWSRRPVFAQAKSRPNIDITTQKIETSTSK